MISTKEEINISDMKNVRGELINITSEINVQLLFIYLLLFFFKFIFTFKGK